MALTIPTNGAVFVAPARITLEAEASDPDGMIARVDFLAGTQFLGSVAQTPFSLIWSNGPVGAQILTAIATDNQGNSATSPPVSVQIRATTISTITAGEIKVGAFTNAGQVDQYEFAGTAGEVVALRMETAVPSYASLALYAPDGSLVTNAYADGWWYPVAAFWQQPLAQTGTYTVLCTDNTTSGTNAYILTLARIVGDNAAEEEDQTLVAGERHAASLVPGDIDVFRFTGATGEVVILRLDLESSTSPVLFLCAPDGSLVTNRNGVFREYSLPQAGIYTVLCSGYYPSDETNAYTLTLAKIVGDNPAEEEIQTLLAGEQHRAGLAPSDIDVFRFEGTAGEVVALRMETAVPSYASLALYAPDGSLVTNAYADGWWYPVAAFWQQPLAQTGTYTVLCTDNTTSGTNAYILTLARIVGDNAAEEEDQTLVAGEERHAASLVPGDIDVFRFTGATGEVVILRLDLESSTSPVLFLCAPDGSLVTNRNGVFREYSLPQAGIYTVLCSGYYPSDETNAYTLTLAKIVGDNPAEEEIQTLLAGEQHRAGLAPSDIDVFRFEGTTGEVVSLVLSNTSMFSYASMSLYGPSGNLLASAPFSFWGLPILQGVRLTEDGTNTLVCWDSTTGGTHSYSVTLMFAPRFVMPPAGTNAVVGSTVALTVWVEGTPPFFYQWRNNGVNIPGATDATFTITNVQVADGGSYSVVVANLFDAVTSDPFELLVHIPSQAPPEDNFAGRRSLFDATGYAAGTNWFATREPNEPRHAGKFGSNSVWYTWRAPATGIATFRTVGSTFDTLLAVYTGASVDGLTLVASDEDRGGFLTSDAQFNAESNTEYQIAIDGFAGQQGSFTLGWSLEQTTDALPEIITAPMSQTVVPGTTVTLSVLAIGTDLTYQWYVNGTRIAGATHAAFSLPDAQPWDVGFYAVAITNSAGRGVVSPPAALEMGSETGPVSEDKMEDLVLDDAGGGLGRGLLRFMASAGTPGYLVGAGGIGWHWMNNVVGTTSPNEANHCGVINNATRWLFLKATRSGTLVIDTRGSSIPTVLAVYAKGMFGIIPTPVACGEASFTDGAGAITRARFEAVSNTIYAVVVDGLDQATGHIQLNWAMAPPPHVFSEYFFTSGAEAWTLVQSQCTNTFDPALGNPDGCLVVTAGATNETWYWTAPASLSGNYAAACGGWLRFDLNDAALDQPSPNEPLVVMTGAGLTLAYFDFSAPVTNSTGWRTYYVPFHDSPPSDRGIWRNLDAKGLPPTREQMLRLLENLSALRIRGKATAGRSGRLDNMGIGKPCAEEPTLKLERLGANQFLLSWPADAYCYQLMVADSILAQMKTNLVEVNGQIFDGLNQAVVLATNQSRFYWLMRVPIGACFDQTALRHSLLKNEGPGYPGPALTS